MKMTEDDASFLVTKEYKRFKEFCEACRRDKYIGLCYGLPGVGKTLSATYYSSWPLIERNKRIHALVTKPPQLVPEEFQYQDTIFYTAEVANSPSRIKTELNSLKFELSNIKFDAQFCQLPEYEQSSNEDYCSKRSQAYIAEDKLFKGLLIVDESDRLKLQSIEQIRDFYDKNGCALILIGMPGLEKKLSRYAQLYSRVGFLHEFRALGQEEMVFIIQNHLKQIGIELTIDDFTDQETILAIFQISRGNFRLLNRLFKQVQRIINLNQLQTITKEIVFAARECLVIGK